MVRRGWSRTGKHPYTHSPIRDVRRLEIANAGISRMLARLECQRPVQLVTSKPPDR
jgi:hypothetical protein